MRQQLHVRRVPPWRRDDRRGIPYLFRPADCQQCHEPVPHTGSPPDCLQLGSDFPERFQESKRSGSPYVDRLRGGRDTAQVLYRVGTRQRQCPCRPSFDLHQLYRNLHRNIDGGAGQCRQHQRIQHQGRDAFGRPYCGGQYQCLQARCSQYQILHHQYDLYQWSELFLHQGENRRLYHRR